MDPSDPMRVYLGLGSNLGDRLANLREAIRLVQASGTVEVVARSSVWQSAPVGPAQPDYLNAVIAVETALSLRDLLRVCKVVERDLGRDPQGVRWGPRPIDLDLLLADTVLSEPDLQVPHAQLHLRAFVLRPLCEVAPASLVHPVLGQPISALLAGVASQVCERAIGLALH